MTSFTGFADKGYADVQKPVFPLNPFPDCIRPLANAFPYIVRNWTPGEDGVGDNLRVFFSGVDAVDAHD